MCLKIRIYVVSENHNCVQAYLLYAVGFLVLITLGMVVKSFNDKVNTNSTLLYSTALGIKLFMNLEAENLGVVSL